MNYITHDDCEHRKYQKGCKIASGDPYYPASAWGAYLPGDEPGNYCDFNECSCECYTPIEIDSCGRMEKTEKVCPKCLEEEIESIVYFDKDLDEYYCPECGEIHKTIG
jgi:hypothetical protein